MNHLQEILDFRYFIGAQSKNYDLLKISKLIVTAMYYILI